MNVRAPAAIARIADRVAIVGFAGLTAMALLTFYDGAARWLEWPRLSGFHDYPTIVYPIVIASCFPSVLLRRANITIRLFAERLGPRANAAIEAFAAVLTLLLMAAITWQIAAMAFDYHAAGRVTNTVALPMAPSFFVVAALLALATLVQGFVTLAWLRAAGWDQPESEEAA